MNVLAAYPTPRARKHVEALQMAEEGTVDAEHVGWYWLFWSNGTHRVGLFAPETAAKFQAAWLAAGYTVKELSL